MKNSTLKGTASDKVLLGQYNTPKQTVELLIKHIESISDNFENCTFLEPSFGCGNIIEVIKEKYNFNKIIGFEIDPTYDSIIQKFDDSNVDLNIKNFYDVETLNIDNCVVVFGNPPYRTPAQSLNNRKEEIKRIKEKYKIGAIKEEAIFFILKTIDLISEGSHVFYILPITILQNPTKAFKSFQNVFRRDAKILEVYDVKNEFPNVDQDLVLLHFVKKTHDTLDYTFKFNDDNKELSKFITEEDVFSYHQIFKKTYLGSVPCESIFLSCKGEPKEHFIVRIKNIFSTNTIVTEDNVIELLSFNGKPHLTALQKNNPDKKKTVTKNINTIKNSNIDLNIFNNESNYKEILHRKEVRYYFRHESLKSFDFIYILNTNTDPSFYFTGNPTKISTDYFGFTDYDCNRNSSPGSIRTIPIENIEENIKDEFKKFWVENSTKPITEILNYLLDVSKSDWWKSRKIKLNKQYFSVPKNILFDKYK
jgi:hypothetical protein